MSTFQSIHPNSSPVETRLRIEHLISSTQPSEAELHPGSDVVRGLSQTPKTLPPRYFYDDRGSQLFEQICNLPEYYLTRTETNILQQYAGAIADLTGSCELIELGSGSSTKTRILLDAYQNAEHEVIYCPIDISAGILESSAQQLLLDYPDLRVHGFAGTYELALEKLPDSELPTRVIGFIGSTLGNLNPQACETFIQQITNALKPGEYFLLGIDLHKSTPQLEAAYNDSQGITAAFNLNMLRHLNRRFAGDFDLTQFEHVAIYNESQRQIEMHLRSVRSQVVHLKALDLTVEFAAGETILSEISRKFDLEQTQHLLESKGLTPVEVWTDQHHWFGVLLCQLERRVS
ncbi:L-histidine N(alpha)-methyltransferase [Myxacorys almedinensis]|uniref:L-histidine N(Alpha)-methyltransferase n=1 Tax=Myxacorys almedinensis A TaxID=2690445 RepID=A0A8J7YZC4_9CYAN|nr:L-histidine N(alpha)-methyltransferase [Myxacorys almedinensis]NDJ17324.1 L-histidine N(alpha)-methyltransferase [Myxacorys almedinensis A]